MDQATLDWWTGLSGVAVLNIALWVASARLLWRDPRRVGLAVDGARASATWRLQLLLSAGYVFGCAYRSLLPVYDVQRLCLVDSTFASVIVGRSVATIAELCFVGQWALLLRDAARAAGSALVLAVSRLLVPMIIVAETCSWYSVLTTDNIGHVFEESLWGLAALLVSTGALAIRAGSAARLRPLLGLFGVAGLAYAAYMAAVDVPMYWARWIADETHARAYLTLDQGVVDAALRRVVSYRWQDWRSEVVWMTLYFSVAVWLSIGLVHVRIDAPHREEARARRARTDLRRPLARG